MKTIVTIIILALIGWGLYASVHKNKTSPTPTPSDTTSGQTTGSGQTTDQGGSSSATSTSATPSVKSFTVVGKSFSFTPATMEVNKGDTVRITFQNSGGNHDWVIDEFNTRTKVLTSGQSETVQFVADKTGSFEYYCSVGTHRQMGMRGTLTVK